MDTDALSIKDEGKKTSNGFVNIAKIVENPELPDMLRDIAPFFSSGMRQTVMKFATVGEFMQKMNYAQSFSAQAEDDVTSKPIGEMYTVIKKYIPMNKRQGIDGIINTVGGIRTKFAPKPHTEGLDGVIDSLTKFNEMKKIMTGLNTASGIMKQIGSVSASSPNAGGNSLLDLMKGIMTDENMKKISGMLGNLKNIK